ncbi:MAG: response regulator [Spirochaetia bacterium]|nr:response regulator [Spirochaetia bacterium]
MNEKILIIDDSRSMVKSLELLLKQYKFNVESAHDGISGLEKVKSFRPDLIFLDIEMPQMDGFDTLVEIKKLMNRDYVSAIIMLSSHHSQSDVIKAMKNGAQDYIVKPFDENILRKKINKYLNIQSP